MYKLISILALAFASLTTLAHAQTCINNIDINSNICTNFTTGPRPVLDVTNFTVVTQDGITAPVGSGFVLNYPQSGGLITSLPDNPLVDRGYLQPWQNLILAGGSWGAGLPTPHVVPNPYTITYTLQPGTQVSSLCGDMGCLAFSWQGSMTVTYVFDSYRPCGGRVYRKCVYYKQGSGVGELSAVPVLSQP